MKKISTLIQWFGSNRMLAANVGKAMGERTWVGVPFAGGMCELPHIKARTIVVNDLHRHAINLASVVGSTASDALRYRLDAAVFHPDQLAASQRFCLEIENRLNRPATGFFNLPDDDGTPISPFDWAFHYFVCAWMTRAGDAGTGKEFTGKLCLRWDAGGGDSAVRMRNAAAGLKEWHETMQRCTFSTLDVFDFLPKCKDLASHGIYSDAPWPDDGDGYQHAFGESQQRRLASALAAFQTCRVVVRFGDHPLIRELYPESAWKWNRFESRTAVNKAKAEVLLVRN